MNKIDRKMPLKGDKVITIDFGSIRAQKFRDELTKQWYEFWGILFINLHI